LAGAGRPAGPGGARLAGPAARAALASEAARALKPRHRVERASQLGARDRPVVADLDRLERAPPAAPQRRPVTARALALLRLPAGNGVVLHGLPLQRAALGQERGREDHSDEDRREGSYRAAKPPR